MFEQKIISTGNNYPAINFNDKQYEAICIYPQNRKPLKELAAIEGVALEEIYTQINELLHEGLVDQIAKDIYLPNFPVIAVSDANKYFKVQDSVVSQTISKIEKLLSQVKDKCMEIRGLSMFPFESISLLILSNVLLDNFQIRNVEKMVLQADRPSRSGKNYYFSLQEKGDNQSEAFGIYGNMYLEYGSRLFAIYGNNRNKPNFLNISDEKLKQLFPLQTKSEIPKETLLIWLEDAAKSESNLEPAQLECLASLGLLNTGLLDVPILTMQDVNKLYDIAAIFTTELVTILNNHKSILINNYENSPYVQSVTFEEYFIWWYHLYYTKVTDSLIARGLIIIPECGNFQYIVTNDK